MDGIPSIDEQRHHLREGICTVKFKKDDGTLRTMRCTLKSDLLPPSKATGDRRDPPVDRVNAYDVEKEGWRSYFVDRVVSFEIGNGT
jgi:WYL domain-containing protein